MDTIDTESFSEKLRSKAINIDSKTLSITNFANSEQEKDFTQPANCGGFGRIRHFKIKAAEGWPLNPLPIVPALRAFGLDNKTDLRAQVFQNSVCNWRCWYCFVDFKLLSGSKKYSSFLTCDQLLDMYLAEEERPLMIDLTGGQPDLTPEWVPWMMEAITNRGMENQIYLWSDDNLSNDYFWRYLSDEQISQIQNYKMYGRVCCFKGIDPVSFEVNTQAHPDLFNRQFDLFRRFDSLDIDLYAYITLTASQNTNFDLHIPRFFDRIQEINEDFPLRIVPLKIFKFTPMLDRHNVNQEDLLIGQERAMKVWQDELSRRFTASQLSVINIKL